MQTKPRPIDRIEKKIWQLILLAVVVVLYLTISLLAMQFLNMSEISQSIDISSDSYKFSIFLATLVLLFCGYMIVQQRQVLHLTKTLFEEKEVSQELSYSLKTLETLFDVSLLINSQQTLSNILNTITREILSCFDADHSSIMLMDRKTGMLKTMSSFGQGAELAKDALVPLGKGIAGWVLENGKPLLLNGKVDPADFPGTADKIRNISSSLCVPLKIGNKNIGVLSVNLVDRDRSFRETDLKLISVFGNNAAVAIHNSMLAKERSQHVRLQTMFAQLHSPRVVQELVKKIGSPEAMKTMRKRLQITVLFADIRGFSNMINTIILEDVMDFLDEFYGLMTKAVFENEGNIDKFIGDEVMAFFGAPNILKNSSENALNTAVQMVTFFEWLKEKFSQKRSPYFEKLGIGVGINTGEAFVGHVGSTRRYDYTVIGNTVNLARRLCSHATSGQILVTDQTLAIIPGPVRSEFMQKVNFKGIPEPVNVHKIFVN
ncbi:MAG: GAF domain-containing protein [Proteobacteria bacterium]|nr:GAF domain-containing protein [Pseudomonadota bacterium]